MTAKRGLFDAAPADLPHYIGHRERLKERFMTGGEEALPDYELLELVLFAAIPRRDVKPLAKALIERFGSFASVISATPQRLKEVDGVGDAAIQQFKIVRAAALRLSRSEARTKTSLSSWRALVDYCMSQMAHETREQFRVLFLDRKNVLIADEVQGHGTVDHTPVYPREVMRRALELAASAIIIVHNHPSGDATPSSSDVEMTKEIVEAAQMLGIAVHDHFIIGKSGHQSLKQLGLM